MKNLRIFPGSFVSPILPEKQRRSPAKILAEGNEPVAIEWGEGGEFANIIYSNGQQGIGSCVRCPSPPCMEFREGELEPIALPSFPFDRESRVCPTSAIRWPMDSVAPEVLPDLCILCGICVSRCPVKAIALTDSGAVINDEMDSHWVETDELASMRLAEDLFSRFDACEESGVFRSESEASVERFGKSLAAAIRVEGSQFPNLLARNLLIALGVPATMRRRGDTNMRIDLALSPGDGSVGVGEVELGEAVMGAPRDLLDDVAVLVSRYNVERDNIIPIVVTEALPNSRVEYWQVVSDIQDALDISIRTLTIGAMIVILWARTKLTLSPQTAFYLDANGKSLIPHIEKVLGRRLLAKGVGYEGCFECSK